MTDLQEQELHAWIDRGDEIFKRIDRGNYGLLISLGFALGRWWEQRPWKGWRLRK